MPIPAGTRITFTVVGSTGSWIPRTPDTVRAEAISEMSQSLTANSLNVTKTSGGLISAYPLVFGYTATLVATTKYGHAHIEDIASIVRSAFWNATGEPPTVSAHGYGQVTQQPGSGDNTPSMFFPVAGFTSLTIVAAVGVAVFVLKRG